METIGQIATGLASNPTAWMLAIALVTIGWLYKARSEDQKQFFTLMMAEKDKQIATVEKIVPIAEKLTDGIDVLERITNAALKE